MELVWSEETPTEPGWYWFRLVLHVGGGARLINTGGSQVVKLYRHERGGELYFRAPWQANTIIKVAGYHVRNGAEYAGPIPEPVDRGTRVAVGVTNVLGG